jgi:hypothetical protein
MPVKTRSQTKCESVSAGKSVREGSSVIEGWVPRNAKGYPSVGQLTLKLTNNKNSFKDEIKRSFMTN